MRSLLCLALVPLLAGCGPERTLQKHYEDCIETYEDALEEVKDDEDLHELMDELQEYSIEQQIDFKAAEAEIKLKLHHMDEDDRVDYVEELAERLDDLSADCWDAKKKLQKTIDGDDDLSDDMSDWKDTYTDSFKDACETARAEGYGTTFLNCPRERD